ncbi:MAG: biotin/lipoyl-binding protein [bacterium]|nr:biotin/lipoyl-binding protein [bacterium]
MGYHFELQGETFAVHPVHRPGRGRLAIEGRDFAAELFPGLVPGEHFLEIDGRQEKIFIAVQGDLHFIHWRGRVHRVEAINALGRARRAADPSGGAEVIQAPMPGTVVEVAISPGDAVTTGQLLMTIESMKLQTAITAEADGVVGEVCVAAGDTFDQGDALVRLSSGDGEAEETTR